MRKLQRSVIRHTAEKTPQKTIKVFRYLWKQSCTKKGHIAVSGGKQIKHKSLLHRKVGQVLKEGK
jgi:hypothetical protein